MATPQDPESWPEGGVVAKHINSTWALKPKKQHELGMQHEGRCRSNLVSELLLRLLRHNCSARQEALDHTMRRGVWRRLQIVEKQLGTHSLI